MFIFSINCANQLLAFHLSDLMLRLLSILKFSRENLALLNFFFFFLPCLKLFPISLCRLPTHKLWLCLLPTFVHFITKKTFSFIYRLHVYSPPHNTSSYMGLIDSSDRVQGKEQSVGTSKCFTHVLLFGKPHTLGSITIYFYEFAQRLRGLKISIDWLDTAAPTEWFSCSHVSYTVF